MVTAWRIVKTRHIENAFDGAGARRYGGRWSSPGQAVVYNAQHQSLAVLEILVHVQASRVLDAWSVIPVTFDRALVDVLEPDQLPADWRSLPPPVALQAIGDAWIKETRSVVLRVPSAIIPTEWNFLINPAHPDFNRVSVGKPMPLEIDPRLQQHTG